MILLRIKSLEVFVTIRLIRERKGDDLNVKEIVDLYPLYSNAAIKYRICTKHCE